MLAWERRWRRVERDWDGEQCWRGRRCWRGSGVGGESSVHCEQTGPLLCLSDIEDDSVCSTDDKESFDEEKAQIAWMTGYIVSQRQIERCCQLCSLKPSSYNSEWR